jgi:hypothetical protein
MRSLRAIGAAALFILQVARCDSDFASSEGIFDRRDNSPGPGHAVLKTTNRANFSTTGAIALDGRALIAKWLNPGGLEKRDCTGLYKASCGGRFRNFPWPYKSNAAL